MVGPAVSTFYWDAGVTGGPALIRQFFEDGAGHLPTVVSIQVDGSGDILTDTTGNLSGTWSEATPAIVNGANGNDPIDGVGFRVRWNTSGIHNGRRVKGTTFIVPLPRTSFDSAGIPGTLAQAAWQTAADDLVTAADGAMLIWSRPSPGGSDGETSPVTSATVPRATSWLRTRRT